MSSSAISASISLTNSTHGLSFNKVIAKKVVPQTLDINPHIKRQTL